MVGIPGIGADEEALKVLVDEPAGGGAAKASSDTDGTIGGLDLDTE